MPLKFMAPGIGAFALLLAGAASASCPQPLGFDPCLSAPATTTYTDQDGNTYSVNRGADGEVVETLGSADGGKWTAGANGPGTYTFDPPNKKDPTWTLDSTRLRKSELPTPYRHTNSANPAPSDGNRDP